MGLSDFGASGYDSVATTSMDFGGGSYGGPSATLGGSGGSLYDLPTNLYAAGAASPSSYALSPYSSAPSSMYSLESSTGSLYRAPIDFTSGLSLSGESGLLADRLGLGQSTDLSREMNPLRRYVPETTRVPEPTGIFKPAGSEAGPQLRLADPGAPIFQAPPSRERPAVDVPVEPAKPYTAAGDTGAAPAAEPPATTADLDRKLSIELAAVGVKSGNGALAFPVFSAQSALRQAQALDKTDPVGAQIKRQEATDLLGVIGQQQRLASEELAAMKSAAPLVESVNEVQLSMITGASSKLVSSSLVSALDEDRSRIDSSLNRILAQAAGRDTEAWTPQQEQIHQRLVGEHNLLVVAFNRTVREETGRERTGMFTRYRLDDPGNTDFRWDALAELSKYLIGPAMTLWVYDEQRKRDKRQFDQTLELNELQWNRELELARMNIASQERIAGMELASAEASSGGSAVPMSPASGRAPVSAPTRVR